MDWLKKVVKVEATTTFPLNIRAIFSKFGEIIDLYPCKTGIRGSAHIFIKFKDEQSARLAINGKLDLPPGVNVYSLSDNPRYVDQYRGVASVSQTDVSCVASNSRDNSVSTDLSPKSASRRSKQRHSRWATKSSGQFADFVTRPINSYLCTPALPLQTGFLNSLKSVRSQNFTSTTRGSNPSDVAISKPQPISDVASNTTPLAFSAPLAPRASTRSNSSTCVQPPSCTPIPLTLINPCFSLSTRLSLCFHGEIITYDLEALDLDTCAIIELLKITDSERGNWMTVGAYYRRSGNTRAAMAVIRAMIEAMTEHGIPEGDLKPAFLFLSSCETDLARQARMAQTTVEAAEHYENARTWLQKVYGTGKSPVASQTANTVESVVPSLPLQPSMATTQAIDYGDNVKPGNKSSQITAGALAQQRVLEREIQSLRDRQLQQSSLLSETRVAKRKLEDDFDDERDLRYRLQRCLDDTRKELDMARKMEMYALDRVKREVEARRKAEDVARAKKNQRLELYDVPKEHTAQLLTEDAIVVDGLGEVER